MIKPPKDIPPEHLFRVLLRMPRPTWPLDYRIRGAEDVALSVRALTGGEYADARAHNLGIAAAALLADGRPAFRSVADIEELPAPDGNALIAEVFGGLAYVSPIVGVSSQRAWLDVLGQGAEHASNQVAALSLGSCFEVVDDRFVDRPERWFGVPARELTDAHWFAYLAARDVYRKGRA